ncbi:MULTISPECIES: pseudouridine synthase [Halomonadaceae]|uniref:Pseudouridine synthase n=1 Tax=Vreelandella piezotolerans TaxID=2609667 RepID=A0ABQ6XDE8_9GAMM|nr:MULTISPECIES: pseudouridine synthase [Halomonas]KAE8440037.1 pseudouridine synthase [Halomonas piezotolerans]MCG7576537.1 pseudouridine synthase [Halomonas sp. MMH1-48]MCG7589531.1 pseudouridine synthase [Halomonas sp. McD50-5]MCG7603600.1 pseudouridine synthase [Halomonas sp. MM17-34]MCG7612928.1 pseudouridine synthase [Halomonas sp. MM17-29]
MSTLYLLHKPYRMLSQFTDSQGRSTLADVLDAPGVYAAGRLDYDSEGLLLLSDDGNLIHRIAHPRHKQPKTYWVQLEGHITDEAIRALVSGVTLKDGPTLPAKARRMSPPDVAERAPAIDPKRHPVTSWLELTISEGRNRQVRRMTAHVGFPTLRLIRAAIGPWQLGDLAPGQWRKETLHAPRTTQATKPRSGQHKPLNTYKDAERGAKRGSKSSAKPRGRRK